MTQKQKQETVRLTVDFPLEQHKYIKMMAAKEGISMRQFIIEHLPNPRTKKTKKDVISKSEFDNLLEEVMTEYAVQLRSLSKR